MLHRAVVLRPARLTGRYNSTATRIQPSHIYFDLAKSSDSSVSTTPDHLSPAQRDELESALRVDQAGEVAANYIYRGQLAVLGRDPQSGPLIKVCHLDRVRTRIHIGF
jgi:ubiquinone biosynthesis monooxygenase Coq7